MSRTNGVGSKIILGIDPGTVVMGYGLIEVKGNSLSLLAMGSIKLSKYDDQGVRLKQIFERLSGLIEEYMPDEMAIEAPFFGKNVQSMLKLGRAQGVAIAASISKDIPYMEYAPRRIKQSITGKGSAAKEQVAAMLKSILSLREIPTDMDASDGVAAAVCHHFNSRLNSPKKSYSGWSAFVSQNPERTTR